MKLSDAGRKVWDRPWSKPTVVVNRETAVEDFINNGVPFGWVVAKDCLQGALANKDFLSRHNDSADGGDTKMNMIADEMIEIAMALCNALAEEGL